MSTAMGLVMVGMMASPAAAQDKFDIAAGYNYFHTFSSKSSIPGGVFVGFDTAGPFGLAVDLDYNRKGSDTFTSFVVGPRFTAGSPDAKVFSAIEVGVAKVTSNIMLTPSTGSTYLPTGTLFTVHPNMGVDVRGGKGKAGVRLQGGLTFNHRGNGWDRGIDVGVGVVFGAK
jgi:hypothetical protein